MTPKNVRQFGSIWPVARADRGGAAPIIWRGVLRVRADRGVRPNRAVVPRGPPPVHKWSASGPQVVAKGPVSNSFCFK